MAAARTTAAPHRIQRGGGMEVIGMDGNDKDCGGYARSLLMVVVVNGGGNGIKWMEPIGIDEGCGKDAIATAAISCRCI